MLNIYIKGVSSFVSDSGNKSEVPSVPYVTSLFRRRMTKLSKIVTSLAYELLPDLKDDAKIYFVSFNGESERQLKINTMVLQETEILPATFSSSVFNTPPAMMSIALGLKNGYVALYPDKNDFSSAVNCAVAALKSGIHSQILFIYADTAVPEEYENLTDFSYSSRGFATLLQTEQDEKCSLLDISCKKNSPNDFLSALTESFGKVSKVDL